MNYPSKRDRQPEDHHLLTGILQIGDFGLSSLNVRRTKSQCGTLSYVSPEVLSGKEYDPMRNDMWACGVILYVMLTACMPFEAKNEGDLKRRIKEAVYRWPAVSTVSEGARQLVRGLIEKTSIVEQ